MRTHRILLLTAVLLGISLSMPSDKQKNDLLRAQTRRILNSSQPVQGEYSGRELETGLSLIRTANGAIIPTYIEGNAQPFIGENLLFSQNEGLSYALGRSAILPEQVLPELPEEAANRFAIIFSKGWLLPSDEAAIQVASTSRIPWNGLVTAGGVDIAVPNTLPSVSAYSDTTSGWNQSGSSSNLSFTFTSNNPNSAAASAGSFGYTTIYVPREIASVTIDWNLTVTGITASDFISGFCGIYFETTPPPTNFPGPGVLPPSLTDQISFNSNQNTNVSTTITNPGGVMTFNFNYLSLWCGMFHQDAAPSQTVNVTGTITNITYNVSPGSLWIGGDRSTPFKLMDTAVGAMDFRGGQQWSMAATSSNIYAWLQNWTNVDTTTAEQFDISTTNNTFTQTSYTFGDTVTNAADNWRKEWFTLETNSSLVPSSGDSCFDFYGSSGFGNSWNILNGNTLYEVPLGQIVDSKVLLNKLIIDLESAEDAVVELTGLDGTGVSCSEDTSVPDETIPLIEALAEPTETERLNLLIAVPYNR